MLPNWYNNYKEKIEKSIDIYLSEYFKNQDNKGLIEIKDAVTYACQGGKRIRSILALEFYFIFSRKNINDINYESDIMKFCIALELLHSYSLVHDDLPSIDNDILRRGNPTVWYKYGESNAILVGDLLNSLSFQILAEVGNINLIKLFGNAVGISGMIGGQTLDIYYEKNFDKLTLDDIIETYNKKTGALIEISIIGGILLGNLGLDYGNIKIQKELESYSKFGKKIGLAFQVKDDLLDIEGSFKETGKSVGGEDKGFVYFVGIEKSKYYLKKILEECYNIVSNLNSEKLFFLISYIGDRRK